MYKTKLGLSNCLVAAIIYFLALIVAMGYTNTTVFVWPFILLIGYVFLKEEDIWLKASAVKAVLVILFFMLVPIAFSFVYDIMDFINFFLRIAKTAEICDGFGIIAWLCDIVVIAEKVFLILLALLALKGKTIKLPFIDGCIRKHLS